MFSHCPCCSTKREHLHAVGWAGSSERRLPSAGMQLRGAELGARVWCLSAPNNTGHTGCTTAQHGAAELVGPHTAPSQPLKLSAPMLQQHTAPSAWHHHSPGCGSAVEGGSCRQPRVTSPQQAIVILMNLLPLSILGNTQKLSGQGHRQPAPANPASAVRLDRWAPEVPASLYHSVTLWDLKICKFLLNTVVQLWFIYL